MSEQDWADEIAKGCLPALGNRVDSPELIKPYYERTAAALRKAREQAFEEAEKAVRSVIYDSGGQLDPLAVLHAIRTVKLKGPKGKN